LTVLLTASCSKDPLESAVTLSTVFENVADVEAQAFLLINEHRTALGMNALQYDNTAYAYAGSHTDYMITQGEISHDDFTARASSLSTEVGALAVAENVASNYPTAEIAVENWLQSSEHTKAIEGDFTHSAISVKADENGTLYYTQFFFKK